LKAPSSSGAIVALTTKSAGRVIDGLLGVADR
jgi:hypothetical protein